MRNSGAMSVHVHYDDLVSRYEENLTTVLRGFSPAERFLETWVHDEDDAFSLLNMIEAAQASGLSDIRIELGPESWSRLDWDRFQQLVEDSGRISHEPSGDGVTITFTVEGPSRTDPRELARASEEVSRPTTTSDLSEITARTTGNPRIRSESDALQRVGQALAPDEIHECYREALSRRAGTPAHEGPIGDSAEGILLESTIDDCALVIRVRPGDHVILEAAFSGGSSSLQRGLLDALCEAIEGHTVQDASDHGVMRLENSLRDANDAPPVPGIITPGNASPHFQTPLTLVRTLLEKYCEKTGHEIRDGFGSRRPDADWISLNLEGRKEKVERALREFEEAQDLATNSWFLLDLDLQDRVTIRPKESLRRSPLELASLLLRLERALQVNVVEGL